MKRLKQVFVFLVLVVFLSSNFNIILAKNNKDNGQGSGNQNSNKDKNKDKNGGNGSSNGGNPVNPPAVQGSTTSYGFEVQNLNLPKTASTNETINVDLMLKNTSNFTWKKGEVEFTYHFVDGNGQYEVFRGNTSSLKNDLAPNEVIQQKFQLKTPSIPGVFNFSFDLVKSEVWFTKESSSRYQVPITITGNINVSETPTGMSINDGAEFANNPELSLEVTPYSNQPGSENAAFVYDYAQATDASAESIANGTAKWSTWELLSNPWAKSKIKATLVDQSVGIKRLYVRYRAFKKQSTATPEDYGSAEYHYGRSEKTTGAYFADEIFFDNVPPTGGVQINNGAFSTASRTGDLHVWATDEVNGVMGSGLNGMRWTNNCNLTNLESNSWSEWEAEVGDKSNISLGTGNQMIVCVQVRDKAGNISTFSDDILFYVPPVGGGGDGSGQFVLGNETYVDPSGNRIVSKLAGIPGNPYGDKNASTLSKPRIKITSSLNAFGYRWSRTSQVTLPPPEITYIDIDDSNTNVTIYGVALQKNVEADFEISYQVWIPNCFSLIYTQCLETKTETKTGNLENVGMSLYLQEPWWFVGGNQEVNWIWNDSANGQWVINMKLNDKIKLGDSIYSKSKAWGILHTGIAEVGDVDYGAGNKLISGDSNHEVVRDVGIDYYTEFIKQIFGIIVTDGSEKWKEIEMAWMLDLLKKIPESFSKNKNYFKTITRSTFVANCATMSSTGNLDLSFDFTSGKTCDSTYNAIGKDEFNIVLFHEIAHAYAIAHPELEKSFADIAWKDSGKTNSCYDGQAVCKVFYWKAKGDRSYSGHVLNRNQELGLDFVNNYSGCPFDLDYNDYVYCIPTITDKSMTYSDPGYESYHEDWAESVTFFEFIRSRYTNAMTDSVLKYKEEFLKNNIFK